MKIPKLAIKTSGIIVAALILSMAYHAFANVVLQVKFPSGKNCVAYKTNKSMMFEDSVDVVGMNCDITVTKKTEKGNVVITTSIPLKKFSSGARGRDSCMFDTLNGKTRPSIVFTSKSYTAAEFSKITSDAGTGTVFQGTLLIGNQSSPVDLILSNSKGTLTGKMVTTFRHFKITPPSVGFGMIADVRDYLELHFQFQANSL